MYSCQQQSVTCCWCCVMSVFCALVSEPVTCDTSILTTDLHTLFLYCWDKHALINVVVCLFVCITDFKGLSYTVPVPTLYVYCTCNSILCTHSVFLCLLQYRIGQLYMIARHSAEESRGSGDGVETMVNEPCTDQHHGDGFYTEKRIYLTR